MTREDFAEFVEAFGWEKRETRDKSIWTYKKDDMSLNYYPTTGTLTVQKKEEDHPYGRFILNKKRVLNLVQVESALEELN